jgi:predicted S18 family serine protease
VIENKLKNIESLLINLTDKIEREKEKMDSISDIEIISISEDRLSDCENNLKEAWKHFYNSRYEDSIRYLSYAQERAKTVERWLSISNRFVEVKIDFNFSKLKQIIEKDISEIVSYMGYASIMGIDVTNIKDSLEKAKEYLEYGKYSSSLFKLVSTKSEIDVNMILESKTNKTKDFLNEVKNDASKKISEAFRKGIIPVLALNYYEYGETLEEKDLKAALSYFVSAKNFAKNSIKIFETYQGKELMETEKNVEILPYEGEKCKEEYIVLSFAFGALTSFIFLFFFKSYKRKRNKNFSFF